MSAVFAQAPSLPAQPHIQHVNDISRRGEQFAPAQRFPANFAVYSVRSGPALSSLSGEAESFDAGAPQGAH